MSNIQSLFLSISQEFYQFLVNLFASKSSKISDVEKLRAERSSLLNRMANDCERSQPNLAAELRCFACRD